MATPMRRVERELRDINREQVSRLAQLELLKIRISELERGLADAVNARDSVTKERDALRNQLDKLLAKIVSANRFRLEEL
jgi:chromosome segregation ATPase